MPRSFDRLSWSVHLGGPEKKARRSLDALIKMLGENAVDVTLKDGHAEFFIDLDAKDARDAVFRTLRIASRIARHWVVRVPDFDDADGWNLAGSINKGVAVAGVESIGFEIVER